MLATPDISPLALAIRRSGNTQRAVAQAARISEAYLSALCNDKALPSPVLAAYLGMLLEADPNELFPGLEDGAR